MKEIELDQGAYAFVDDTDYPILMGYKWHLHKKKNGSCYAITVVAKKPVLMHRMILQPPIGSLVDHINNNGLDNRRRNLRLCTSTQNCMNRSKTRKSKGSKYKGVWFHKYKENGYWRAGIRINNKTQHLGIFKTELGAALAYNEAAEKLFGEFAHLNKVN